VLAALRQLVPALRELISAGQGVIFYGSVGTGKDHLMAALLYEAARQEVVCRWVNGQEVFGMFRDSIRAHGREDDLLRQLTEPKVLAISDPIPPAGTPTAWNLQLLYRLVDRRYRKLGSTWASPSAASIEDADAKLSAPVFDRLRERAVMPRCFWPSYRERRVSA
jgi:DNA replication protein DnaC